VARFPTVLDVELIGLDAFLTVVEFAAPTVRRIPFRAGAEVVVRAETAVVVRAAVEADELRIAPMAGAL